jgi:hypothetical protein
MALAARMYRCGVGGGRGLLAIVVGIVVLLAGTVAAVLVAGNRPPRDYPGGSPEAALQTYLRAWEARDLEAAWSSFSVAARTGVTLEEYRSQVQDYGMWAQPPGGPSRRVYVDRSTVTGDRAELELTVEETWVQGLSVVRNRTGQALTMIREDGQWRFDALFLGLQMGWPGKGPFEKAEPEATSP